MNEKEQLTDLDLVISRLQTTTKSLTEISDATGLGYHWLQSLKLGRISDPGIGRITTLRAYFTRVDK